MLTDRNVYTKPAFPNSWAVNEIKLNSIFNSRIARVTGPNTLPNSINASHSTPSASHQLAWSKDSLKFYLRGTSAVCVPFTIDPNTMQTARIAGAGDGGLVINTTSTEPQFSWGSSDIIYVVTTDVDINSQPIIQKYSFNAASYTTVLNLRTIPHVILPNFRTYCGAVYGSEQAPEKISAFFGGASQDAHYLAAVFEAGNPPNCTVIDTTNSLIYINGAAGVATNITLGFLLHHQQIDRTGRWATLEPTQADITAGKAPKYIWDTQTNVITALTLYPSGHTVMGFGDFINQDGVHPAPYDGTVFSYRALSDLTTVRSLIRDPQAIGEQYIDGHTTWHNALALSLQPVFTEFYRAYDGPNDVNPKNTAPWRAWDDELCAIEVFNSGPTTMVYRFGHHHSIIRDDIDSPGIQPFWFQVRPNISPDGRWAIFTTNGDRSLGQALTPQDPNSTGPGTAGYSSKRFDVFLVELTYDIVNPHRHTWGI